MAQVNSLLCLAIWGLFVPVTWGEMSADLNIRIAACELLLQERKAAHAQFKRIFNKVGQISFLELW